MEKLPIYVLSGGKSSRFGSDKARAQLNGLPLILRLTESLAPLTMRVTVVADKPGKYADLGLQTIADDVPSLGPIGGLHTALRHTRTDSWFLLLSCDFVSVDVAWVETLQGNSREGATAVAFKGEKWEPLFALYHTSMAPIVARHIQDKTLPMWRLLEAANAVAVPKPANWIDEVQINTPEQLMDAQRRMIQ